MARNKYPEETVNLILDVSQKLFIEKGYESTSIQDIINGLGGLSKGAIYHHFKSKEDIFNAVGDRYNAQMVEEMSIVRDDHKLTGFEKLQKMFQLSLSGPDRNIVFTVAPNMMKNPKLLAQQLGEVFDDVAPHYVQPVIEQGIQDGSIQTDYPKELSEVMIMLTNIWLNPFVIEADISEMECRVRFFDSMLKSMGIDLLDDNMIKAYKSYCNLYNSSHNSK